MLEVHTVRSEGLVGLDELALHSKDPSLYSSDILAWWKSHYVGPTERQYESGRVKAAVDRKRLLGFYALSGDAPGIVLSHLFVDAERQRLGVGGLLLEAAREQASVLGADVIMIRSDPNAMHFYRKLGAEIIGSINRNSGYPTHVMQLDC